MSDDKSVQETPEEKKEVQQIDTSQIVSQVTDSVNEGLDTKIEEITGKVAEDVTAKTTESIVERIQGKKKEEYEPKSWKQVRQDATDDAVKVMEEKQAARVEKEKEAADAKAKIETDRQAEQNKVWDEQLARLVEEDIIPDMSEDVRGKLKKRENLTKDDMEDAGFKARVELFRLAKENPDSLGNLELVARKHYKTEDKQPGSDAPVFGDGGAVSRSSTESYTYEDIHNTDLEELIREGKD